MRAPCRLDDDEHRFVQDWVANTMGGVGIVFVKDRQSACCLCRNPRPESMLALRALSPERYSAIVPRSCCRVAPFSSLRVYARTRLKQTTCTSIC